jgi:hypothetical protein
MISHIHESGNTEFKYDYLKQAAEASIAVAQTGFPGCQLAAILFRGMMPNGVPECPKLALDLKGRPMAGATPPTKCSTERTSRRSTSIPETFRRG